MSLDEINKVRSEANMIVSGYAFTKMEDSNIRVLQLRAPFHALVMSQDGNILETTMDDVELNIILDCWSKNHKYMEEAYA